MSKLIDRYPYIRKIGIAADGTTEPVDLLALIQPYLDWQLAELESASSILLFKPSNGKPTGELVERMVILLDQVAIAWLQHAAQPTSRNNNANTSQ
jgi:hypothetical protein